MIPIGVLDNILSYAKSKDVQKARLASKEFYYLFEQEWVNRVSNLAPRLHYIQETDDWWISLVRSQEKGNFHSEILFKSYPTAYCYKKDVQNLAKYSVDYKANMIPVEIVLGSIDY